MDLTARQWRLVQASLPNPGYRDPGPPACNLPGRAQRHPVEASYRRLLG